MIASGHIYFSLLWFSDFFFLFYLEMWTDEHLFSLMMFFLLGFVPGLQGDVAFQFLFRQPQKYQIPTTLHQSELQVCFQHTNTFKLSLEKFKKFWFFFIMIGLNEPRVVHRLVYHRGTKTPHCFCIWCTAVSRGGWREGSPLLSPQKKPCWRQKMKQHVSLNAVWNVARLNSDALRSGRDRTGLLQQCFAACFCLRTTVRPIEKPGSSLIWYHHVCQDAAGVHVCSIM